MTGTGGEVRCGGRLAAVLGKWAYTGGRESWTVTATASLADPYWLGQDPELAWFRLVLNLNQDGTRRLRWHATGVRPAGPDTNELTITGQGAPDYG